MLRIIVHRYESGSSLAVRLLATILYREAIQQSANYDDRDTNDQCGQPWLFVQQSSYLIVCCWRDHMILVASGDSEQRPIVLLIENEIVVLQADVADDPSVVFHDLFFAFICVF